MRPLTVAGHPLHPQLVGLPLGMLPFSFFMDVLYQVTRRRSFADAALYSMVGGTATALAAGAAGAVDYMSIPKQSEGKQLANTHAIMNLTAVALYATNIAMRQRNNGRPTLLGTILNGICCTGLTVSQWYGGELVYKQQMRVQSGEREEPSLRPPGDRAVERGLHRMAEVMPAGGPANA